MRSWRAAVLVFGSSAAVLMLEILAGRLMAPYVGVSLETFTGIIGTILAGIAAGAAWGGSIADRRDPRPLIGPALVLGGALSWASLPIVRLLGPAVGPGAVGIVLLTAAAFLAPATVLSAVAPMVAKLRLGTLDETGTVVGGLSAAGTAGAIAGTFLTGFVLVAALPSQPVVIGIGALLVASGLVASWRLGRAVAGSTLAAVAVVAGIGAVALPPPCDRETAYFCVRVEEDPDLPSGRVLVLDRLVHAHVDLEDPSHLELRYVRLLDDVVEAAVPSGPVRAVHLGGGGFTLPRHLAAERPGSEQVVLEIDPELVEVAEERLDLTDDPGVDIRIGDARLELPGVPSDSADVVVGDAFASTSVPWHLTTVEVMDEIRRILAPGGVYVMNVLDGGASRYARAQAATLRDRFEHVAAVLPVDGIPSDSPANIVLVASDEPPAVPAVAPGDGEWVVGDELDRWVGDAMVLTDAHAPVDQLIQR